MVVTFFSLSDLEDRNCMSRWKLVRNIFWT